MKWLGLATVGLILVPFFVNSRGKAVGSVPARNPISHQASGNYPVSKNGNDKARLEQAQLQLLLYQAGVRNQTIVFANQKPTDGIVVSKK